MSPIGNNSATASVAMEIDAGVPSGPTKGPRTDQQRTRRTPHLLASILAEEPAAADGGDEDPAHALTAMAVDMPPPMRFSIAAIEPRKRGMQPSADEARLMMLSLARHEQEREEGATVKTANPMLRTAAELRVGMATLKGIRDRYEETGSLEPPPRAGADKQHGPAPHLDAADMAFVDSCLESAYAKGSVLKLYDLRQSLATRAVDPKVVSKETLRTTMHHHGFDWKIMRTGEIKKLTSEVQRLAYEVCKTMVEHWDAGVLLASQDESYIYVEGGGDVKRRGWSLGHVLEQRKGKGAYMIINAIITQRGLVGIDNLAWPNAEDAACAFWPSKIKGNYHKNMNGPNWQNTMGYAVDALALFGEFSVLFSDNASYHKILERLDLKPTTMCRKPLLAACETAKQRWGFSYNVKDTVPTLRAQLIAAMEKAGEWPMEMWIEARMREIGGVVQFNVPGFPEFNPIEMFWAAVKKYVLEKSRVGRTTEEMAAHLIEALKKFGTAENCSKLWRHSIDEMKKFIQEYEAKEAAPALLALEELGRTGAGAAAAPQAGAVGVTAGGSAAATGIAARLPTPPHRGQARVRLPDLPRVGPADGDDEGESDNDDEDAEGCEKGDEEESED